MSKIDIMLIPDGWRPIEGYMNNKYVIIVGTPENEPDEWVDDDPRRHNCDEMGCGSAGPHILMRLIIPIPHSWNWQRGEGDFR